MIRLVIAVDFTHATRKKIKALRRQHFDQLAVLRLNRNQPSRLIDGIIDPAITLAESEFFQIIDAVDLVEAGLIFAANQGNTIAEQALAQWNADRCELALQFF